ncbi:lytic transglycosylase domain-containing protein [Petrachloros mirabilis]
MANKSIIDIEVNDDQFKAFYELFEEYKKHLGSAPDDWKKIDAATKKAAKSFQDVSVGSAALLADIAANTKSIADGLKKATEAQKQLHNATRKGSSEMRKMAGYAAGLSKSIFGIGKYLFKIGALGGGISLLGGFGLRELGTSAVSGQRQARGLGLNQGQVKAWQTDMAPRYLGANVLSSVANAQNDFTGRVWLARATGMSLSDVASQSPDKIALQLALKGHDWWKNTPSALRTTQNLQSAGFLQSGLSLEDMRRLGHSSRASIMGAENQYRKDAGAFNIDKKTVSNWYKFTNALGRAGNEIETVFTKRLADLAPVFGSFVKTLTSDATAFINSTLTPENMKAFAAGLKDVASYLGSKDFRQSVKSFGSAIVDITNAVLWAAKAIGAVIGNPPGKTTTTVKKPGGAQVPDSALNPNWTNPNPRTSRGIIGGTSKSAQLSALERQYNLPPGTLDAIWATESSRGKNAGMSSAGALGPFQLTAQTAKALGVTDRTDFAQSAKGAAMLMQQNLKTYNGDLNKALAAYNWGPGNAQNPRLNADIAKHNQDWLSHAPRETQNYVNKIVSMLAARHTTVTVTNNTASKVAVSTNAAAY